ncbi:hypothetical protein VTN02DRAFT_6324 [Thermoascus thermophilus]
MRRPGNPMPQNSRRPVTRLTAPRTTTRQSSCMERPSSASRIRCTTPTGPPAGMCWESGKRSSKTPAPPSRWTASTSRR